MKKILVTGSSGVIGTRLCQKLIENGHEVVGVDWKPNKWDTEVDSRTIRADLCDLESINKLPKDIDIIFHLAANARVYNLVVDPTLARDNFLTLFTTLEYARLNDIKSFIFASSREVYGNLVKDTYTEDDADIKNCENAYSASKIGGEALLNSYTRCYGLESVIFRFSNVYGMYDESDRVIPLFIKKCAANEPLVVYGESKILDFVHIDDVVDGLIKSLTSFESIKGEVFNLASGTSKSILFVAETIKQLLGSSSTITIKENRVGEAARCIADITKIESSLKFTPQVSCEDGLKKTVTWYKEFLL